MAALVSILITRMTGITDRLLSFPGRGSDDKHDKMAFEGLLSYWRAQVRDHLPRTGVAQHPQVCFQRNLISSPICPRTSTLDAWKRSTFECSARIRCPATLFGEASPSYLYSPQAIRAIGRMFPAARFLVMVHNPLEMLPSWRARVLFTIDEDVANFEDAWRLQEQRAKGQSIPAKCRDWRMLQYAEVGRVGTRLAELIHIVGRDRVKAIVFDDFTSAPLAVYREVLDFLALEYDERTEIVRMNGTKTYRSPFDSAAILMRSPKNCPPRHPSHGWAVTVQLARRLVKRLRKANVVRTHWQPISARMRQELVNCVRDDVDLEGRLLNRDLGHWLDIGTPSAILPPHRTIAAAE
jgi:hypothetical protein